jgi:general secretion pathway protein G
MRSSRMRGFTLVEILIVVIILAVLAAIVLPQFGQATTDARLSSLKSNLQTIRAQLQTYKVEHVDAFPDTGFCQQMTIFTDTSGGTAVAADSVHSLGPYLMNVPPNPISTSSSIRIVNGATTTFTAPTTDAGWWYNSTTGEFRADLRDTWTALDGTKYNEL